MNTTNTLQREKAILVNMGYAELLETARQLIYVMQQGHRDFISAVSYGLPSFEYFEGKATGWYFDKTAYDADVYARVMDMEQALYQKDSRALALYKAALLTNPGDYEDEDEQAAIAWIYDVLHETSAQQNTLEIPVDAFEF